MSRDHASYRNRVQDIRSEARSLIERLRAERLAKSRFAAKPVAAAAAPPAPSMADIEAWTGGAPLAALAPEPAPKKVAKAKSSKPAISKPAAKPVFEPVVAKPKADAEPVAPVKPTPAAPVPAKVAEPVRPTADTPPAKVKPPAKVNPPAKSKVTPAVERAVVAPAAPAEVKTAKAQPLPKPKTARPAIIAPVAIAPAPTAAPEPPTKPAPVERYPVEPTKTRTARKQPSADQPDAVEPTPAMPASQVKIAQSPPKLAARVEPEPASIDADIELIDGLDQLPSAEKSAQEKPEVPAKPKAKVPPRVAAPAPPPVPRARPAKAATLRVAPSVSLLPGIGPGLIWRLEQSGYRTLDDVAAARVEELRARLGAVGNLVKLDRWIAFAQENAAKDDKAA